MTPEGDVGTPALADAAPQNLWQRMFGSDAGASIFSADADGLLESEESSDGPPAAGADCCELTPELLALLGLPADAFGERTLVPDVELLHHIRTCSEHPEPAPPAPRERVHSLGARRAERPRAPD